MGLAGRELKNIFANRTIPQNQYQHSLSFLRGTFMEPLGKKFSWLKKLDKTLYDTKFGTFIQKLFNVKEKASGFVKGSSKAKMMMGYQFSGNIFSKTAGRTLLRIPILGLATSIILELPAIIKSASKGETFIEKTKSFTNQLCKSAGYIGIVNTAIAFGGALLFPYGYLAALIGSGIGGTLGLIASQKLNKQIDKTIT